MRDWSRRLQVVTVIALLVTFGVGGYAAQRVHQKQDVADAIATYYESTRGTVKALCDDPRNAAKPECSKTPPPAEKIVKATEDDKPAPTRYTPPDPSILEPIVRSMIYAFCGYDGSCQGTDGTDGKDAPPVTASQVGEQVAAQLDAALARNCGGSCVGPAGAQGAAGAQGTAGVGIAGSSCDAQGRFVLELTDGTEVTVDGSRCRPFYDAPK